MIDGRVVIDPHTPRSVRHGTSVSFHVGTSEVAARLILLERPALEPGEEAWAQLRLAAPVVARRGDRFILRTVGGEATLGGGQIVDAHPLKHRRHRDRAAQALARVAEGGLQAAIVHELHKATQPLRLSTLAIRLGESPADIQAAEGHSVRLIESGTHPWLYDTDLFEQVAARAVETLTAHHRAKPLLASGLTIAALASAISPAGRLSDDVISAMMSRLVADGRLRRVDNTFALASHNVEYDEKQAAIRDAILTACLENPFSPPTTTDLQRTLPFPPDALAAVHEALIRSGELIDGDVCGFHPQAVAGAWEELEAHLRRHGQVTMSEFRKLLSTSRRYALGLMAHFDAQRLVVREGDYRRLP
jgi:selenocysteine-specific elongation factor